MKNLIIAALSFALLWSLSRNFVDTRPFVFNTQPLMMGWKIFRSPWLEITEDHRVCTRPHSGWRIHDIVIDEQAGTVGPVTPCWIKSVTASGKIYNNTVAPCEPPTVKHWPKP